MVQGSDVSSLGMIVSCSVVVGGTGCGGGCLVLWLLCGWQCV